MMILFCEIGWMKYYNGTSQIDPYLGENEKEVYNFQDYNGFCYGSTTLFPQIPSDHMDDVLVVWTAKDEYEENPVVVGWYQHATIYRHEQIEHDKYAIGRELQYIAKAKSEDCVLLDPEERNFTVPEEQKLSPEFLAQTANYVLSYPKNAGINIRYDEQTISAILPSPGLNYEELVEAGDDYIEEEDYYRALVCFNTAFHLKKNIDAIFNIASMLESLFCFDKAILVFEKLRELEGDEPDTLDNLLNLYLQTKQYKKALTVCDLLVDSSEDEEEVCGLLCAKADILVGLDQPRAAAECLDFIMDHSDDDLMKAEAHRCKHQILKESCDCNDDCGCSHHHDEDCTCHHEGHHHCHDHDCNCCH